MKRSKTQAVYRFLPDMWISEKDDSVRAISARIKNWNYIKMSDIYEDFVEEEIKRQREMFVTKLMLMKTKMTIVMCVIEM